MTLHSSMIQAEGLTKRYGSTQALAGIADYWIINLIDRQLEVYRDPGPDPWRDRMPAE